MNGCAGADKPPVKYCPVKGCGKKMAAFRRGNVWKYICPDEAKHAQDKLKAAQAGGPSGRGGVKPGTPSPKRGLHKGWRRVRRTKDQEKGNGKEGK